MKKQAVQAEEILNSANKLRWQIGDQFHDSLMESIYRDAERISQTVVNKKDEKPRFNWDRTLDRILTSRVVGLPVFKPIAAVVVEPTAKPEPQVNLVKMESRETWE